VVPLDSTSSRIGSLARRASLTAIPIGTPSHLSFDEFRPFPHRFGQGPFDETDAQWHYVWWSAMSILTALVIGTVVFIYWRVALALLVITLLALLLLGLAVVLDDAHSLQALITVEAPVSG
jgi:hypothetical protein